MAIREFDLTGRQAVVIGGSRGIGRGIALALAEAGADVAVASQHLENAEAAAVRVAGLGVKSKAFAVDATSLEDVRRLAGEVLDAFPGIDILVNCVGDAVRGAVSDLPGGKAKGMVERDWQRIINLNLTSAFNGCSAFGAHLTDQKRGSVINVSGVRALRGAAMLSAYSAGKAGIVALTEATALEWAPYGVRVNAIVPGSFPDPEQGDPAGATRRIQAMESRVPLGRVGDLRDVGLLAVYLASDASSFITGTTVVIDGGESLV